MKNVLIIHGWESGSKEHWYQEEKKTLEGVGYKVEVPDMPNANFPIESEWIKVVSDFEPDEESILIGHSLGAPAILRYLENTKRKVSRVFLIAGFASSLHLDYPNAEYPDKFVNRPFNWAKIKTMADHFVVLSQDHDEWVPFEKGREIADALNGELVEVSGTDHFDKMDLNIINSRL